MDNIEIKGYEGTWYAIASYRKGNIRYYLLRNDNSGMKVADVIIDENYELIATNVKDGFKKLDKILWEKDMV